MYQFNERIKLKIPYNFHMKTIRYFSFYHNGIFATSVSQAVNSLNKKKSILRYIMLSQNACPQGVSNVLSITALKDDRNNHFLHAQKAVASMIQSQVCNILDAA